jgi:hypothetical protein
MPGNAELINLLSSSLQVADRHMYPAVVIEQDLQESM